MKIDLNTLPKVDGDQFPVDGFYVVTRNGNVLQVQHFDAREDGNLLYSYYGPIEFVPPKVIPPKPDIPLVLVEHECGLTKWAWRDGSGDFWWSTPGDKDKCSWWSKGKCKVIET